ncbi:V-set and transmembrane domain-containing protein 4 isoform X2 [Protopterus annectens]|uniref:V-set and transmembrane domain-containing protein 4 isoform X2 n=1 Tax=Protopterus annectens TaxID=7888 RepID=UPI001CFBFB7C|nr:V-set and transmembrane domain-containing protein 4 isoform X2 [Protopterus annectens]
MNIFLLVSVILLTETFAGAVCEALNVTVIPMPTAKCSEGENVTLECHISQKRRSTSLITVRWLFSLSPGEEDSLMVKMNKFGEVQYYGNYSLQIHRQRLQLLREAGGLVYKLLLLNVRQSDQGYYICKVQEVGKHKNKWTAWSNGTATTILKVISPTTSNVPTSRKKAGEIWKLFEDLYLCSVLVCSFGIICVLLFTLIIICQTLFNRRRSKARCDFSQKMNLHNGACSGKHYLVKCPQNSSGETVTSMTSLSPLQPQKKKKKSKLKEDVPPAIPAKVPRVVIPHRPKLLKPHTKKLILPKIAEESLTYAELELVKTYQQPKGVCTGTVYAQILFEENQV